MMRKMSGCRGIALAAVVFLCGPGGDALAQAAKIPEIRTSQRNAVPACVTPDRLMAFLRQRNGNLDPRFRNIAHYYKQHGDAWRVRWDYAFFQMAIETNFLSYLRPNGRMGDVDPKQNNFAGIGTTGGGVPGDSFPDVSTGVLGQIQHLVVYSGEWVDNPVASRTRLKQDHILALSRKLNRPVLWSDLARRWAVDPKYANSIEWVAGRYRAQFCGRNSAPVRSEAETLPWQRSDAGSRQPAARPASIGLPKRKSASAGVPAKAATADVAFAETAGGPVAQRPLADGAPAPAGDTAATESDGTLGSGLFALFAAPEGFAGAITPEVDSGHRSIPQPVLDASPSAASDSIVTAGVAVSPADPQAVSGTSVGGFVIAGADSSKPPFDPPSGLGVKPGRCKVETATYGGETTVLIRTRDGADTHYVALSVLDGFEDTMTKSYLSGRPNGGEPIGTYPSREIALKHAREHCPEAAPQAG